MRTARSVVLALLGVLTLGLAGGAAVHAATKPDFTIGVNPVGRSVQQGQQATYAVTVTATGGFTGSVALAASGRPAGATVAFEPPSLSLSGSATSTLTVSTTASTPVGSHSITITASSGKLSHALTVTLTVNRVLSPSFAISVTPASVTVPPGSVAVYTITLTRTDFTGAVTLTLQGGSATFSPNPVSGSTSTLQVTTSATTPDGASTLYVVGSAVIGSATRYAYAQAQLVVDTAKKPFTISGDLPGAGLAPGAAPQPLGLVLRNPNNQDLAITNLTVTVSRTSAGTRCTPDNFTVVQFTGAYPVRLAARQTASLAQLGIPQPAWPRIGMLDLPRNQDGCKGVALTLAYSGSGQGA
jgi:hypothetical protein